METRPHQQPEYLRSAVIALVLAGAILLGAVAWVLHLEKHSIRALAPLLWPQKSQGIAVQKVAACNPGVLLLYGSSELFKKVPGRSSDFFSRAPTGFEVCPVGMVGATSLVFVQKLAALGAELRGKKLAVLISPHWFFYRHVKSSAYAGNFSRLQANEWVFGCGLNFALKRDIARRMLELPEPLAHAPLLTLALKQLAADSFFHRCFYYALLPMGWMETEIMALQDHFETALYILHHRTVKKPSARDVSPPDWKALFTEIERNAPPFVDIRKPVKDANKKASEERAYYAEVTTFLSKSDEWKDLDLLLRVLKESGSRPLLVSIPMAGSFFDSRGFSYQTREIYYSKLRAAARAYDLPLLDFEAHDGDLNFLHDNFDHLGIKGWLYVNKGLDDFFHDFKAGQ